MNSKEALERIREAEKQAQDIIDQAKNEARRILNEERIEKERILKAPQEQARLDSQKFKAEINEEILKEVSLIEGRTQDEIKALQEKASINLDKVLDFIKPKLG